MAKSKYDEYREKIERIQNIVDWRDEERVGLYECHKIGELKNIDVEDIKAKSKNLPDKVKVLIFGGLVDRGHTTHDIDMLIVNKSKFTKDDVDKKMKSVFCQGKGRLNRVYNLKKFEDDMIVLKSLVELFDKSDLNEKRLLCEKLNPIIEIHSHCVEGEQPEELTECLATEADMSVGSVVLECTNKECILHDFGKRKRKYGK